MSTHVQESKYTERKKCIFCQTELKTNLFPNDLETYVAHYSVPADDDQYHLIPYNVLVCNNCKTPQIKYLGDIDEVYRINHADGTGLTMHMMHECKLNLLLKHRNNINGILEIGSSKGILSDLILKNIKEDYYIVDPSYFGDKEGKTIISDYYENVDDSDINANTIIMSHVFEHFYDPLLILEKIRNNLNIENIFLTFPNFEKYISEGIHHVLNTEHTFYVDNEFIKDIFAKYGFELIEEDFYKNHSVFFYFKRNKNLKQDITLKSKIDNLDYYFNNIYDIVNKFNKIISNNKDKKVYIFPASCHSIFLSIFGLDYKNLAGMVDNSPNKIGKNVYGLGIKIFSLTEIIQNKKDSILLINGGIFNSEIENTLESNNIEYYVG